jgi:serine protease Do
MKSLIFLFASLFVVNIAHAETQRERNCRATFESAFQWNDGSPKERYWDQKCWDYVKKSGGEWKWVGDAEARRLAEEIKRKKEEEERRIAEAERKKKEEITKRKKEERDRLRNRFAELALLYESRVHTFLDNENEPTLEMVEAFLLNQRKIKNELLDVKTNLNRAGEAPSMPESDSSQLANLYLRRAFEKLQGSEANLWKSLQGALLRVGDHGISPDVVTDFPMGLYILDLKQAANDDESQFKLELSVDELPKHFSNSTNRSITVETLSEAIEESAKPYNIVIDISNRELVRDLTSHVSIPSKYLFDEELVPNPEYRGAQMDYFDIKDMWDHYNNEQASCNASKCIIRCCLYCNKMCKLAKKWQANHRTARREFLKVKEWIKRPIYRPYEFRKTEISISKIANPKLYVFRKGENLFYRSQTEFKEEKQFSVLYGFHEKDKERKKHKRGIVTEQVAADYAEKPIDLPLAEVLDKAFSSGKAADDSISIEQLFSASVPKASGSKPSNDVTPLPANGGIGDGRFSSVVIVLHPEGSIGTGFYIDSETILTNYHVIEGTQFLEIILYNGSESFGKVIAKDIRLDLALIKVQQRGRPVKLSGQNNVAIGETVDAIGHPEGLEYSLTRGTISGVRRLPSLYDPGGRAVRFIQSDVAINPGNSGGPLFFGDEVVGVNDWKLAATELEGLSFSIHVSEIRKFLKKHGF